MHQWTVNSKQETKEKDERQEREAEAREERMIQIYERMVPTNQNKVPRSIENTNDSTLSLSNLTPESNQLNAITPLAKMRVPKRNIETLDSIVTDDIEVATKYQRINGNGDSSGSTAPTTGLESHSEDYHDPNNGDESAQHHDHQTGLSRQNHKGPFRED